MGSIVFRGGSVVDGTGAPSRQADVLVSGTSILDVGPGLEGDDVVECGGLTIIPGLFDCHAHMLGPNDLNLVNSLGTHRDEFVLMFPERAREYLAMGITTVRDAGWASLGMKTAIDKGIIAGPRLQLSISILSSTGGHMDGYMPFGGSPGVDAPVPGFPNPLCDGVDECEKKTREVIRAGADVVKICVTGGITTSGDDPNHATYSQDEIDAFVRTARDLGRPVMAHAHGAEGIKRAVRAGVRSIEHGTFLDEEGAEMMAEAGTWLVATLTAGDANADWAADESQPDDVREKVAAIEEFEGKAFELAVRKGVRVAMGTDCPIAHHGTNLRELELMVEHGLSPDQALVAATSSSAELMGLADSLGTIEPDKTADLVLVDGDPYEFGNLKERIVQVWKDGTRFIER